jgi:hypothetical protein
MNGFPGGSTWESALFLVNLSSIRSHTFYSPYVLHYNRRCSVTSISLQTGFATSAAVLVMSYAP